MLESTKLILGHIVPLAFHFYMCSCWTRINLSSIFHKCLKLKKKDLTCVNAATVVKCIHLARLCTFTRILTFQLEETMSPGVRAHVLSKNTGCSLQLDIFLTYYCVDSSCLQIFGLFQNENPPPPTVNDSMETLSSALTRGETNTTGMPARPARHLSEPDQELNRNPCLHLISAHWHPLKMRRQ